jgi:hypothetical protein
VVAQQVAQFAVGAALAGEGASKNLKQKIEAVRLAALSRHQRALLPINQM